METIAQDLKQAFRMFRENKVFTSTAIIALTLGIGVNVAIFSVVNAVVLKPLPFDEPDRIIQLMNTVDERPVHGAASPAKFMHWREQTTVLQDVAAQRAASLNFNEDVAPERVTGAQVTEAYFRTFRAPFLMGRSFSTEEDLPGAAKSIVLRESFWTSHLEADPNILGETLILSGDAYTIIGVVSDALDLREFGDFNFWIPFQLDPNTTDQGNYFSVIGRLRPDISLEQAQDRLAASGSAYKEKYPLALQGNSGFSVVPLAEAIVGRQVRTALYIMLGAVGFVLLIACANVANLLLVRAAGRQREIAIRSALGAGRWRILRQLLTESVTLSLIGGALGLVLGFLGMRWLLGISTVGLPRLGEAGTLMGLDGRVVAFTVGLSILTGLVFGLVPALVTSSTDLNTVIKDSSSRSGSGFRQNKTRSLLVIAEVSLAVILLIGAALLIRTSVALDDVDPGFNTDNVIAMRTSMAGPRFETSAGAEQIIRNALERIRPIPGVEAVAATCCVPLQGGYSLPFTIIGRDNEGPYTGGSGVSILTGDFFDVFEVPLLKGRSFSERDNASGPPVAIVNQAFVDEHWPDGGDPLGEQVFLGGGTFTMTELEAERPREIVGVVGSFRARGLAQDPGPLTFVPQGQVTDGLNALNMNSSPQAWIIRTAGDPTLVSAQIQAAIQESTGLPVTGVQRMSEIVRVSTSRQRVNMILMTTFGAAAVLLAAIGIYGLMAYSVQQRTQEIGIRIALGSSAEKVRGMVVRQGMALIVAGLVIGLVSAYFLAAVLASVLFGVDVRDPTVFVGVPALLTIIAVVAIAIPAHRASRTNPLTALRHE